MKIEQIKKALECCEESEKCDVCPYYGSIHCQEILIKDALGFINRQQTEIERLKTENGHFERNMKSVLEIEKENIRKETAKEILNTIINESNIDILDSCYLLRFSTFNRIKNAYDVKVDG